MLKNRYITLLLASSLLFGGTACNEFLDVNQNVDDPTTTTSNLSLPGVQGMLATTFYEQMLRTSYFTQYRTGLYGTATQTDRWDYSNVNRIGEWRRHYFDTGGNAYRMLGRAQQDKDNNYVGVSNALLAYSTLMATDMFGDMPVSEAYQGKTNPRYESQEEVYAFVHAYADAALQALPQASPKDTKMTTKEDMIYGGDLKKWEGFAHAVKARAYLHVSNRFNKWADARKEVEAALATFGDAQWLYSTAATETNLWQINPLSIARPQPQWDHVANDLETAVPTSFFIAQCKRAEGQDPRLAKLLLPSDNSKTVGSTVPAYQGAPSSEGIGSKTRKDYPAPYDGFWTSRSSKLPILLKEELKFIEAEASFQLGDKTRAHEAYKEAIRLNMQRLAVADADIAAYLGNAAFVAQTPEALGISHIMTQKYVALYMMPETWVDMRRYNYNPEVYTGLTYPKNSRFANAEKTDGRWIARMIYDPQTEYIYNLPEIERLGAKADDWVVKKMWWQPQ